MPLPGSFLKKLAINSVVREAHKTHRFPKVVNLSEVKKAGLLAEIDNQEQLAQVRNLIRILKSKGTTVRALYFFNEKNTPNNFTPTGIEEGFSRKQLRLSGFLPELLTAGFTGESYDLLIDLSSDASLPLKWIAVRVRAGFKASLMTTKFQPLYDLMIACPPACTFSQRIDEMLHYLNLINSKA